MKFAAVLLILFKINYVFGFERDLTINVDPGKSECFYQHATVDSTIDIEYQVIDGTRGSLDIAFVLTGPGSRVIVALSRKQSGIARAVASATGDYRFCFDNTHSTISSKTVYFDILIDDGDESDEDNAKHPDIDDPEDANELENTLIEVVGRVSNHLSKARRLQEAAAARFARDDHAAARILSRVTNFSTYNAIAVLVIGIFQVILLRSLFDETSRVHSIWNKIPLAQS